MAIQGALGTDAAVKNRIQLEIKDLDKVSTEQELYRR